MDVLSAAFNVVHDAGGAAAVGQRIGKRPGNLAHELHPPPGSTAKLGLLDAIKITLLTRDFRILYAFADECGHICIPHQEAAHGDVSTNDVLMRASHLAREIAETFGVIHGALADGVVTPNEMAKVERESMEAIAAITDVVRAMRDKMDSDQASRRRISEVA